MTKNMVKWSEFGLIAQIKALCESLPLSGCEGIGDDCAVMPIDLSTVLLFTQDALVERVHFLRDGISPYDLGAKSLSVNISDVAAMGGRAVATLLSICVPRELMGEWIEEFIRGYRDKSEEYGVALIGGDTTSSKCDFCISITAIGRCKADSVKRRSAAKVGDVIAVTAPLGASGAGLADILNGATSTPNALIHCRPTARIEQGAHLGKERGVNAMMDISDGVASDLRHITTASNVAARIELNQVPVAPEATLEQALSSGEDYELLMTIAAEEFEQIQQRYTSHFGYPLIPIGTIEQGEGIIWALDGVEQECCYSGFTHY